MTDAEMLEENARDAVHKVRCGKASPELAVELAGYIQGLFDLVEQVKRKKDRECEEKVREAVREEERETSIHRREADRLENLLAKKKEELDTLRTHVKVQDEPTEKLVQRVVYLRAALLAEQEAQERPTNGAGPSEQERLDRRRKADKMRAEALKMTAPEG